MSRSNKTPAKPSSKGRKGSSASSRGKPTGHADMQESNGRKLTLKEQRLIEGVLQGKSGARAARDAGYSARSARQIATENLSKPDIQARIQQRIAEAKVETDEVVGTLVSQMRTNPLDMIDAEGRFSVELARQRGLGHLIKGITITRRYVPGEGGSREIVETTKLEVHNSFSAAAQLCKVRGIEQQPAENEHTRRRRLEEYRRMLTRLIAEAERQGETLTTQQAVEALKTYLPDFDAVLASQLVM